MQLTLLLFFVCSLIITERYTDSRENAVIRRYSTGGSYTAFELVCKPRENFTGAFGHFTGCSSVV